ncbi:MAG: hypothetical protein V4710_05465 [Verrucomicrobiota bacterium]
MLALSFLLSSLAVLGLCSVAGLRIGSRPLWINTAFGSFSLLLAAHHAHSGINLQWSVMLAFFVTMVLGGRAMGTWIRSWRESELRRPSFFLIAAAACSGVVTVQAFLSL